MKKIIMIILTLTIFCVPSLVFSSEKVVHFMGSPWQPYYGDEMENRGICSEIVTEAYKRVGYSVKYTTKPWARVINEVKEGKVDGTHMAYWTEERSKTFHYSDPMLSAVVALLKRKDRDITWSTMEDLKPYKIGVERGSANEKNFDAADFLTKEETTNLMVSLKKLVFKRIDLVVGDPLVADYLIKKNMPDHTGQIGPVYPLLHKGQSLYVIFSLKTPDYKEKADAFNRGLKMLLEDGTLDAIKGKYGM